MKNTRKLTIRRKGNINGMAMKFAVLMDNHAAGMLVNGGEVQIEMDMNAHELRVVPSIPMVKTPAAVHIPAGFADQAAMVQIKRENTFKLGFAEWTLELEQDAADAREEAKNLFIGALLMLTSRSRQSSLMHKMAEFREKGCELQVTFIFGEQGVHVHPEETTAGCFEGEAFDISLDEITSGAIRTMTMQERLQMAAEFEKMIKISGEHSALKAESFGPRVRIALK